MPQFLSPGAAAANAIEEYMLRRAEQERQARADQRTEELHKERLEDLRYTREQTRLKDKLDLEDRERARVKEETAGMVPGDELQASMVAQARAARVPLRTSVGAPSPAAMEAPGIIQELSEDGMSGETPVAEVAPGAIRFAGTPAQVKELEAKAAQQKFIESLKGSTPAAGGTGAAQSAAARSVGLPMTAADFEPPAPPSKSAAVQEYEFYKAETEKAGQKPLSFDEYQARDANRKRPVVQPNLPGGMNPKVFQAAMNLGKSLSADPVYKDMLDIQTGALGVEQGLAEKNGIGDIAAINALQRMIDPGATVREGDVKLMQSANAFMQRLNPEYWRQKLEQGAKLPDGTRAAMLKLSKELYKVRAKNYDQMTGKKFKRLAKEAGVDFEMVGEDFEIPGEESAAGPAGVPEVGGTFQGGKVLKVTPLN